MRNIGLFLASWLCLTPIASAQAPDLSTPSVLSAVKSADGVVISSTGGAVTYKAVVDGKRGGEISQVCLPADGNVVAQDLNDIFYFGDHGKDYTLRGWTGRNRFPMSCSVDVISQKPDQVVVQVNLLMTGIIKNLATDETLKATIRKTRLNFKEKAAEIKRTYTFEPDRIVADDQVLWVNPDTEMKTFYYTAAFVPGSFQGPARLTNGTVTSNFYATSSSGEKIPAEISFR